ncbi:MAG: ATP-binding protein [Byssovorax sp.]
MDGLPKGDFIGRARERAALEDLYRKGASAFVPIYGRRRVGKTELIRHFVSGKPHVYFVGKRAPAALQIQELLETAAESLGQPLLATATREHWKKALLSITDQWKGPGKLVLALDEFQWMAEQSPELTSVLQECWDRRWRDAGNVMLILCGSYVGFMEREVLGKASPLFGRRTAQIKLLPFGYREAALFHPGYSLVDKARTYFICGGIPQYLRCFRPDRSVEENIAQTMLDPIGPLYNEPDFLLREELREVERYATILMSLARGPKGMTELAKETGLGRGVHYHLQQLVDLGYLGRRFPLTGKKPSRQAIRYALEDPLLRFWFHFVYPRRSLLADDTPERSLEARIKPGLDAYFGKCFERLCREALPGLYRRRGVSAAVEAGEFWNKEAQIDVVAIRDDGWTDLGECRWGQVASARALLEELRAKVAAFPNQRGATTGLLLFTRAKLRSAVPATCFSLADLYA